MGQSARFGALPGIRQMPFHPAHHVVGGGMQAAAGVQDGRSFPGLGRLAVQVDAFQHALLLLRRQPPRSEEHTSELQSLMRTSYAVFFLKKKTKHLTSPQSQLTT